MRDHDQDNVRLALLAHDLRTPLSAMRLAAELIGNGPLNDDQNEKLSILIRSIDSLTALTGELVATAAADQEEIPAWHCISDVVENCAELFRIAADQRGLEFELAIDDEVQGLETIHAAELHRVIAVVLDNAVKYTNDGKIQVSVNLIRQTGTKRIAIAVADTGPGIGAEEAALLFQPFKRGRQGLAAGAGAGLGLWGADLQMRELGGELELVQSDAEGCKFSISLPVEDPSKSADPEPGRDHVSSGHESPAGLQAHVLIVDDNETNCRLLSTLVRSFGGSCHVAYSGDQALESVRKNHYDAVLLDLNMPEKSGIETAREISADQSGDRLPLIAVSAALESVKETELREAGFREVVSKPISPADLYAALERSLQTDFEE